MPYPNEHSARLIDPPSDYVRVRRTNGSGDGNVQGVKIPATIAVIWYIVKKDNKDVPLAQALRFPTKKWTAAEAKKWLKDHEIKYKGFESAKDSKSQEPEGLERRILPPGEVELRADDGEKSRLVGYAAKYGIFTDLGWFKEKIRSGAFDDVIGPEADVRCLKNHNPDLILGRTKSKTLRLESNTVGLRFDNDVPDTTTGKDTLEEVRRGDLSGCSFSFTVSEQHWKYFEDDSPPERTIIKIGRLFDVGPVTYPAYPDTTVAARSFETFKTEHPSESREESSKTQETEPAIDGETELSQLKEISADEQRLLRRKYRHCQRIIARNRPAEV